MADELRKKADEIIEEIRQEARAEVSPAKVAKPIGLRSKLANFLKVKTDETTSDTRVEVLEEELRKNNNTLNDILQVLKLDYKLDKKEFADDRKERERQKKEKKEKAIESVKGGLKSAANVGKKAVSTLVSPFSNVFEKIAKFLKVTVIGALFNKALDWFGEKENQAKMGRVVRFLKFWWPSILAGYLAFFTPLGGLVTGAIGFLTLALPALAGVITANPILAAAVAAGGLMLGAKALDGDFSNKELSEEEKIENEEKANKVLNDFGVLELNKGGLVQNYNNYNKGGLIQNYNNYNKRGLVQNYNNYNKGGQVPGSGNKDTVPAMLTPGEFVMSKGAVGRFGTGMMAAMNSAGGGTNKGGPFYEGGGLVGDLSNMQTNAAPPTPPSQFSPVKASGMVPVNIPVKVKSTSKSIVLPTITKEKPVQSNKPGTTIPVFDIVSKSPSRSVTLMSLGIEEKF